MSKPSRASPALKSRRVLPQPLDELRLGLQHVDRRQAGGGHGRRMGGREEERPGPVLEDLAQRLAAGDVAAQHADRLGQRPDLDVDPAVQAEVVDAAAPVAAQHAGGVRVVDVDDRIGLLGGLHDLGQAGDVAVHAEHAIGDDQHGPIGAARRGADLAQRLAAGASMSACGKTLRSALVSRMPSMMLAWFSASRDDDRALRRQDRDHAGVGGEAGLEGEDRLDVLELGQPRAPAPRAGSSCRRWCAPRRSRRRSARPPRSPPAAAGDACSGPGSCCSTG